MQVIACYVSFKIFRFMGECVLTSHVPGIVIHRVDFQVRRVIDIVMMEWSFGTTRNQLCEGIVSIMIFKVDRLRVNLPKGDRGPRRVLEK